MIKECFGHLLSRNYNHDMLNEAFINLMQVDEEHIERLLQRGILLMEDIYLYKSPNCVFRCANNMSQYHGRKPICNIIENKLNEKLKILYMEELNKKYQINS